MTRRAIDSQATASAMIAHYVAIGAVVVEERNEAERLRKVLQGSRPPSTLRSRLTGMGAVEK
jgi:hypothetical protein